MKSFIRTCWVQLLFLSFLVPMLSAQEVVMPDKEHKNIKAPEFAPFITIWKTDNEGSSNDNQITIPTTGGGYDYDVYWESTTSSAINGTESDNTGDLTITFPSAGTYRVEISGDFPRIYLNSEGDKEKILTIEQWGDVEWASMEKAFEGAIHLVYNASDAPNLTGVTNMGSMFARASAFNGNLNSWDVSSVTNMNSVFQDATSFDTDLNNWDVSNVTKIRNMFLGATSFNGDLSNWNVSSVTDMENMFGQASSFNGDLSNWNVSNVTNMDNMFANATMFKGDIS